MQDVYNKLKELEATEEAATKTWGVLLLFNPEHSTSVIKKLTNPDTWQRTKGIQIEDKCLYVDECQFEFVTDGEDLGDFYYTYDDDVEEKSGLCGDLAEGRRFLFIESVNEEAESLAACNRLAEEIKRMRLQDVLFIMVARDAVLQ